MATEMTCFPSLHQPASNSEAITQLTYLLCSAASFSPRPEEAEVGSPEAEVCITAPQNGETAPCTEQIYEDAGRGQQSPLPQCTQQHHPTPETSESSQLLLPWKRQREAPPAFDVHAV